MWLKLVGGFLVVAVASRLGWALAAKYQERPCQIRQLISCLTSLRSYINYVAMPLPQALISCTGGTAGPVADLFKVTANQLNRNTGLTPQEAFAFGLEALRERLTFQRSELEIIAVMGANLGVMNREEQHKYFNMVLAQLDVIEKDAIRLREQNAKMYRYLGICGGLAIVLLLI